MTIREHAEAIFQDPDTSWSANQHAQAILDALDAADTLHAPTPPLKPDLRPETVTHRIVPDPAGACRRGDAT